MASLSSYSSPSVRVEKATSEFLIGPDWTLNIDICDNVNSNPMYVCACVRVCLCVTSIWMFFFLCNFVAFMQSWPLFHMISWWLFDSVETIGVFLDLVAFMELVFVNWCVCLNQCRLLILFPIASCMCL